MNWDSYFLEICNSIAKKSPCLSRQIGAILVRDNSIVATGYNGPPRGIPHCGMERFNHDKNLLNLDILATKEEICKICPRRLFNYESGTHMELCPAQHAEENAVSNAARLGVIAYGTTCYLNTCIPCSKCFGTLINAGIREIVVLEHKIYDQYTQYLVDNSSILIRQFKEA